MREPDNSQLVVCRPHSILNESSLQAVPDPYHVPWAQQPHRFLGFVPIQPYYYLIALSAGQHPCPHPQETLSPCQSTTGPVCLVKKDLYL